MVRNWNRTFFDKWSPEMAYVLGFMCADGSVWRGKRGNWFLAFYSTDVEILQAIRAALQSEHKISSKLHKSASKISYFLQIGSKDACAKLADFGIVQNKSLTIELPKIPEQYLESFIRGYFDGDGCVSFKKYWRKNRGKWHWNLSVRFTSGSRKFLEGLWISMKPYVSGGSLHNKKAGAFDLSFSRSDAVALYRLMYNNISAELFLKRKFDIFQKAFRQLNMQP